MESYGKRCSFPFDIINLNVVYWLPWLAMEGHVSESPHHVHAGACPFCRVWKWHTLWLWARRRHETCGCTHPFFTSGTYIVSSISWPPDIVSCRLNMYSSPGRQVNARAMAQQVTSHPTIMKTAHWRRLKGVAHLRRLWWRPTLVPHGSSKQALGINFCSCYRKRSQSASSHASSDFIEEPETLPEYTYLYR